MRLSIWVSPPIFQSLTCFTIASKPFSNKQKNLDNPLVKKVTAQERGNYLIFKLAIHLRTSGAFKNPDSCLVFVVAHLSSLVSELFLVFSFFYFLLVTNFLTNFFDEFFDKNFNKNFNDFIDNFFLQIYWQFFLTNFVTKF